MDNKSYKSDKTNDLTKRELFAAMAMQGMLSDSNTNNCGYKTIMKDAVLFADALIEELNK
jgi:hypothetical protein